MFPYGEYIRTSIELKQPCIMGVPTCNDKMYDASVRLTKGFNQCPIYMTNANAENNG